jgi:DnaK suppressor protein
MDFFHLDGERMVMAQQFNDFQERALLELAEVERALGNAEAGGSVVPLDQSRVGRLSRMDALQQQGMASGLKERLMLQKRRLQATLERMRNGRFGICCECEDVIPLERLRANLAAPFCAYCQEEIDERRKSA